VRGKRRGKKEGKGDRFIPSTVAAARRMGERRGKRVASSNSRPGLSQKLKGEKRKRGKEKREARKYSTWNLTSTSSRSRSASCGSGRRGGRRRESISLSVSISAMICPSTEGRGGKKGKKGALTTPYPR